MKYFYVKRHEGIITGCGKWPFAGDIEEEILPENDPELVAHMNPSPLTNGEIFNEIMQSTDNGTKKLLKALVLCLNDGSIVPGANASNASMRDAIIAKM